MCDNDGHGLTNILSECDGASEIQHERERDLVLHSRTSKDSSGERQRTERSGPAGAEGTARGHSTRIRLCCPVPPKQL